MFATRAVPQSVLEGTYDYEDPDTGNVRYDGLIGEVGALVRAIGWLTEHVTGGRFRDALCAQLTAHMHALKATDWAEWIESSDPIVSREAAEGAVSP